MNRVTELEEAMRNGLTWCTPVLRRRAADTHLRVTVGDRTITCRAAWDTEIVQVKGSRLFYRAKDIPAAVALVSNLLRFGTPYPSAVDLLALVLEG